MQPYPTVQNYGYGTNQYGYQQPVMPYQDRLAQIQNQYSQVLPYNQPQQMQQNAFLSGQMVGSIDEVKAKDVDLSGAPMWFPKADGTTVYRKQLQADGTSRILTYTISTEDTKEASQKPVNEEVLNGLFNQLKQDLMEEISGIKDLVGATVSQQADSSKSSKGGASKS